MTITPKDPTWNERLSEDLRMTDSVRDEIAIIWTEDVSAMDYVRQSVTFSRTRKGRIRCPAGKGGRSVGYAVLSPDVSSEYPIGFVRRVFWVKDYDRSEDPSGIYAQDCPCEAVDPRTVAPGELGYVTVRARGRAGEAP